MSLPLLPEELASNRIHDELAASYGCDLESSLSARLKLELAKNHIGAGDRVLDVGCANGLFMLALAPHCGEIVGIDINERMLAFAQENIERLALRGARVERQSAMDIEFPDDSFDVAYLYSILPLVPNPEQVVRETIRILRPGGVALFDVPGRYNLSRLFFNQYYRRMGHPGVRSFRKHEFLALLDRLGLQVIEDHALGFTDQWKYVPGLHLCKFLNQMFHRIGERDLDYVISNWPLLKPLANRWYIACRKK